MISKILLYIPIIVLGIFVGIITGSIIKAIIFMSLSGGIISFTLICAFLLEKLENLGKDK